MNAPVSTSGRTALRRPPASTDDVSVDGEELFDGHGLLDRLFTVDADYQTPDAIASDIKDYDYDDMYLDLNDDIYADPNDDIYADPNVEQSTAAPHHHEGYGSHIDATTYISPIHTKDYVDPIPHRSGNTSSFDEAMYLGGRTHAGLIPQHSHTASSLDTALGIPTDAYVGPIPQRTYTTPSIDSPSPYTSLLPDFWHHPPVPQERYVPSIHTSPIVSQPVDVGHLPLDAEVPMGVEPFDWSVGPDDDYHYANGIPDNPPPFDLGPEGIQAIPPRTPTTRNPEPVERMAWENPEDIHPYVQFVPDGESDGEPQAVDGEDDEGA